MDDLKKLVEIEAVKRLKARYFRFVDTFDLEGWLTCFTDDVVCLYDQAVSRKGSPAQDPYRVDGKAGIVDFWETNQNRLQSVHHGHMAEIDIVSDSEARGIWAMEDIVIFTEAILHGYGHYHEEYRKLDGEWKIARLHLTRTRVSQKYIDKVGP